MPVKGEGGPTLARGIIHEKCGTDEWKPGRGLFFICVACKRKRARLWRASRDRKDPIGSLWRGAKVRAAADQLPFVLTPADIEAIYPRDDLCPALGMKMSRGDGKAHDASPSLDRLDHERGYEPGNIAVISARANRAKNSCSAAELFKIAAWMRSCGIA